MYKAHDMPLLLPHMRVGLFGGSFDPPHKAHHAISMAALRQLKLDRIIWLVTTQNPHKGHKPAPLTSRIKACRALNPNPNIIIMPDTHRHSITTIGWFKRLYPQTQFVWIMGTDNFATLHKWKQGDDIMQMIAVAVFPRPESALTAFSGRCARKYTAYRHKDTDLPQLGTPRLPAWGVLRGRLDPISSTQLRP